MNTNEVLTTPGAYYAVAYWLSSMLYVMHSRRKHPLLQTALISVAYFFALFSYLHLNADVPILLFVPSMLVCLLLMFAFLVLTTEHNLLNSAYLLIRVFILGEFAASFEWQLYFYSNQVLGVPGGIWVTILFLLIIHGIIFSFMHVIERRFQEEDNNFQISSQELLFAAVIGIFTFALSNISYLSPYTPFSGNETADIFNIRTMVDLAGLALLSAYHIQLTEHHVKFEIQKLQSLLATQSANFATYEKSVHMVQQKYHDLKYQIAAIRAGINSGKSLSYLDSIEQDIISFEAQNKTGHPVLDILLTAFSLKCQHEDIKFTAVADGTILSHMEEMDVSTLFGNILDNSYEAVRCVAQSEQRLIHLILNREHQFMRISVQNCYAGSVRFNNGLPVTTKRDKSQHGFGLKSIRSIVRKYQGSLTIEAAPPWFELRLLIPIAEDTTR